MWDTVDLAIDGIRISISVRYISISISPSQNALLFILKKSVRVYSHNTLTVCCNHGHKWWNFTYVYHSFSFQEEKTRGKAIELLLGKDADVNCQDDSGRTALSYACEMRANDVVRILVKNNVDPDIADEKGEYLPNFKMYYQRRIQEFSDGGGKSWVWTENLLLPPANEVWGKVMSVSHFVHSGHWSGRYAFNLNACLFAEIFVENCLKMKEIGPRGGSTRSWHPLWSANGYFRKQN